MPRKLHRNPRAQNPPPRRVEYGEPTSAWQKLVYYRLKALDMSIRELAEQIGANRGSVWIWLHTRNGVPSKRSCSPSRLAAMSKALGIDETKLKEAWDASRQQYSASQAPLKETNIDALRGVLEFFQNKNTKYVRRSQVISMLSTFLDGMEASPVPRPPG